MHKITIKPNYMSIEILLNGISLEELQNTIQQIVSNEVQRAVDILTPPSSADPNFLTRRETADILGISLVTLHEWTKNGVIPAKRIGTRIRYDKQQVYDSLKDIKTLKYRRA